MKKTITLFSILALLPIMVIVTLLANNNSEEPDLIFSHKYHIEELGAECISCHPGVEESTTGADDLLPKEETCLNCHDRDDMGCEACHKSGKNPELLPRITNYSKKFSHAKHIEEGTECAECHAGVEKKETAAGNHIPGMDNCMMCHETPSETEGCYLCHEKDYELIPLSHNDMWKANHGNFAENGFSDCSMCHTEQYCTDCHLGENLFGQSHPPDFIMTHSISYMARESDCVSCHGGYDFCIECHMEINFVKPMTHIGNWISAHADEARMNPDNCVVCHTENDLTCLKCH